MSKIALTIKQKAFEQIVSDIKNNKLNFDAEGGCACGRLEVKLNEQLYTSVYRSCRKSNSIPDNKLWNIEDVEFHLQSFENIDEFYLDKVDIKLNSWQQEELIEVLKEVSKESWGKEYR